MNFLKQNIHESLMEGISIELGKLANAVLLKLEVWKSQSASKMKVQ
jgi:hypothetical protein